MLNCHIETCRAQDAFEAAEAAARVVMDAMEAESAAGRATPSAGAQALEAIQLFEQADSTEVRSGVRRVQNPHAVS